MTAERRALAFLLGVVALSIAARRIDTPRVEFPASAALDLAQHEAAVREAIAASARRALADGERIDPNTAPAGQLERLPRVGPALAARIIDDRERNGPFRTADDLRRVPGIGPALAASLAPHLALPPSPPPPPAVIPPPPPPPPPSPAFAVNPPAVPINTATAEALVALPGVGPVLAARIVAYRDSAGPFRSADDLVKVAGIGPALRERLGPLVTFVP
jgi:competence protein ComEA